MSYLSKAFSQHPDNPFIKRPGQKRWCTGALWWAGNNIRYEEANARYPCEHLGFSGTVWRWNLSGQNMTRLTFNYVKPKDSRSFWDTFTIHTFLPEHSFMLKSYRLSGCWPMCFKCQLKKFGFWLWAWQLSYYSIKTEKLQHLGNRD